MLFATDHLEVTLPAGLAYEGMRPVEQGGILLGQGSTIQCFTRPGPADLCLPDLFMMLDDGHQRTLDETGLSYLGFWHSHPPGTPSDYSPEDLQDWQAAARQMFPQDTALQLFFPIVTGDRLRVWAMSRDLTLTELERRC